jgi:DNA polymerase/3'-5' exonuclease PolX
VLQEIVDHSSCERRDLLLQKFPPAALEFLKIQGLGPKSIALLFEHYQVGTIDELERLCLDQKLRVLPRMGAKLEEKVLKSIAQYRQRTGRYLLSYAEDMARELTRLPGRDARHRTDHSRRQPAARTRNRGRSRPAGDRSGRRGGAGTLRALPQSRGTAGARRE